MTAEQVELDKGYIIQTALRLLERGLSTENLLVVLSRNWHYAVGDIIDTDQWQEMGFLIGAGVNELVLNLPSQEDITNQKVNLDKLKNGSYQWQLVDKYKNIGIIWQE
jgi:hypothetical protein